MQKSNMMRGKLSWALPLFALFLGAGGCTNTVRYMTTMTWMNTAGGGTAPSTGAEPSPGGAAAAAGGTGRSLYVTYWEGTCSSGLFGFGRGCDVGDSKIRRCDAKADNTIVCVEEAEATRAFAHKK